MLVTLILVLIAARATYEAVRHCHAQGRFTPGILLVVGLNWWLGYALSYFVVSSIVGLSIERLIYLFATIGNASGSASLWWFPALLAICQTGVLFSQTYHKIKSPLVIESVIRTIQAGPSVGVGNGLNFVVGAFWGMVLTLITQPGCMALWDDNPVRNGFVLPLYGLWLGGFTFEAIGRSSNRRDCINACLLAGIGALLAILITLILPATEHYPFIRAGYGEGLIILTVPLAWAVSLIVAAITLLRLNRVDA